MPAHVAGSGRGCQVVGAAAACWSAQSQAADWWRWKLAMRTSALLSTSLSPTYGHLPSSSLGHTFRCLISMAWLATASSLRAPEEKQLPIALSLTAFLQETSWAAGNWLLGFRWRGAAVARQFIAGAGEGKEPWSSQRLGFFASCRAVSTVGIAWRASVWLDCSAHSHVSWCAVVLPLRPFFLF